MTRKRVLYKLKTAAAAAAVLYRSVVYSHVRNLGGKVDDILFFFRFVTTTLSYVQLSLLDTQAEHPIISQKAILMNTESACSSSSSASSSWPGTE